VIEAATPEAATAALGQTNLAPQLVLVHSHTRAGASLVRRLHAANPRLRVISTSTATPGVLLPDFPPRALVHLPKPFALSTLLLKARSLLDAAGR